MIYNSQRRIPDEFIAQYMEENRRELFPDPYHSKPRLLKFHEKAVAHKRLRLAEFLSTHTSDLLGVSPSSTI